MTNQDLSVCQNCGELLRGGKHDPREGDPYGIECDPDRARRYNHEPVYGGYTRRQLRDGFALIKNKQDWKLHIDALVPADVDRNLIESACIYHTGSVPSFIKQGKRLRVVAAGYYACIGS